MMASNKFKVNAYPNPFIDQLQLKFDQSCAGKVDIELTGSFNRKSYLKSSDMLRRDQNTLVLNLSSLPSNIYVMKVSYGSKVAHLNLVKK